MSKGNDANLFGLGLSSALVGWCILQFFPFSLLAGYGFLALGGICVMDKFRHMSRFDTIFRASGICSGSAYPIFKHKTKRDGYTLYEFTLPAGLTTHDVEINKLAIEQYLGRQIEIDYGFKNLLIKVFDGAEQSYIEFTPVPTHGKVELFIGYDRMGKPVTVDLSDGEPHMYIAGETGSGKSTSLRSMLVNLIMHCDVDLFLGDLKNGVEFQLFRHCQKVKYFAKNEPEMLDMLGQISREVDRRYQLLFDADVTSIKEYNKSHKPMKYQLVVIDEFATLRREKESIDIIADLAQKSRACGIHLLISTQRPDKDVLNGRIKANIANVLGMKTRDENNSKIIIGHSGLEELRGKGHAIFRRGSYEATVQAPYLSEDKAKELLLPYCRSATGAVTTDTTAINPSRRLTEKC